MSRKGPKSETKRSDSKNKQKKKNKHHKNSKTYKSTNGTDVASKYKYKPLGSWSKGRPNIVIENKTNNTTKKEEKRKEKKRKKESKDDLSDSINIGNNLLGTLLPNIDKHRLAMRDRFLFCLQSLIGKHVSVTLSNQAQLYGLFYSATPFKDRDYHVIIKDAMIKNMDDLEQQVKETYEKLQVGSTMIIDANDIKKIFASSIGLHNKPRGFVTDMEIASQMGPRKHRNLQSVENSWLEDVDDQDLSLGDTKKWKKGQWDQFEANRRLFNVKPTFDEALYTTSLDPDEFTPNQKKQASDLAKKILNKKSKNIHLMEDRGQLENSNLDEEALWSGVLPDDADVTVDIEEDDNQEDDGLPPGFGDSEPETDVEHFEKFVVKQSFEDEDEDEGNNNDEIDEQVIETNEKNEFDDDDADSIVRPSSAPLPVGNNDESDESESDDDDDDTDSDSDNSSDAKTKSLNPGASEWKPTSTTNNPYQAAAPIPLQQQYFPTQQPGYPQQVAFNGGVPYQQVYIPSRPPMGQAFYPNPYPNMPTHQSYYPQQQQQYPQGYPGQYQPAYYQQQYFPTQPGQFPQQFQQQPRPQYQQQPPQQQEDFEEEN